MIALTLSTLKRRMSPAEIDVVHPESVGLYKLLTDESVIGLADVMLSASVGGKFANVSFQISTTIEPV